jgi:hypothetical protein
MSSKFLIVYCCYLAIFSFIAFFIFKALPKTLFIDATAPFFFFTLLSPFTHYFTSKAIKAKSNTSFITYFYAGFALKFFLSIIFVVLFLLIATTFSVKYFALSFVIGYLLYTITETLFLLNTK